MELKKWAIRAEARSRSLRPQLPPGLPLSPRAGAEDAARRHALGPEDRRSDLDHGLHRPQPRLHDLRHAVRHGREGRDQAADGRQVRRLAPTSSPTRSRCATACSGTTARRSPPRTASPRSSAGRAQGRARPEADDLRRRRSRSTDAKTFVIKLKEPTGLVLLGARQAVLQRALHDAQARRRDRSQHADLRLHRLRPVRLQEGRVEARRQDGLRQVRQVQAARRAGVRPRRRQGGQGRPRRVARDLRPAAGGQRAAGRRDRLSSRRRRTTCCRCSRPTRTSSCVDWNPLGNQYTFRLNWLHKPFDNPKIRQALLVRLQPEGLPQGGDRRSRILQGLQGAVRLRHAARVRQGHGRAARSRTSTRRRSCSRKPATTARRSC